jgi:hypothetical protein
LATLPTASTAVRITTAARRSAAVAVSTAITAAVTSLGVGGSANA